MVLLVTWFGGWIAFAAILVIFALMTVELSHLMRRAGYRPALWFSFLLATTFFVAAMLPQQRFSLLVTGIGLGLLISLLLFLFRPLQNQPLTDWALTIALPFYHGWALSCLLLLRGSEPIRFASVDSFWPVLSRGAWWLLVVLLGTWSFDTGAFCCGRLLGRLFGNHPLAPTLSPGKNWEGLGGGTLCTVIVCLVLVADPLALPWYLAILLGLLLGPVAMTGDLSESLLKRQARVKDSGTILPGHGGMLDRTDSVLLGAILVYTFSLWVGQ